MKLKEAIGYLIFIIILIMSPFVGPKYNTFLLTKALIMAIWALAYNILLGYTGMLSFGHALYFGVGAYTVALLIKWIGIRSMEILLLSSIISSAVIGALVGFLCIRYIAVYFALLTLAFGQFFFALTYKLYWITRGADGLPVPRPYLLGIKFTMMIRYFFVLAIFIVSTIIIWWILNSPFGKTLQAIRENPSRAEFVGVNVSHYKWLAFILSSIFSGIAGALYAPLFAHVTPDFLHWAFGGLVLYMVLIGGHKSFVGPIIGAFVFTYVENYVTAHTIYWPIILGCILIIIVFAFPNGIMGAVYKVREWVGKRKRY